MERVAEDFLACVFIKLRGEGLGGQRGEIFRRGVEKMC